MRWEFESQRVDATTYLGRLLALLGDSSLDAENEAAAVYLQALRDLKSRWPRSRWPRANPWPESMVAVALASTRPRALSERGGLEDPARAAEIQRWNSRVAQFVEHGLIRRDRQAHLPLGTRSGVSLPQGARSGTPEATSR